DPLVKFAGQQLVMKAVRAINGCADEGVPWAKGCTLYPSKKNAPFVAFIHPADHKYPAEAPALIVRFFKEHSRPGAKDGKGVQRGAGSWGVLPSLAPRDGPSSECCCVPDKLPTYPTRNVIQGGVMNLRLLFTVLVVMVVPSQVFAGEGQKSSAARKRPNILFLFADDWGRYASAYAKVDGRPSPNQVVQTPNIDRLAREGVLFRNAFVGSPSCTPCRSAVLSGRYFFKTGRAAILQGAIWDAAIPSWPLLLQQAGYFLGKSFKVWSPGTPVDAPFGGQKHAFQSAGGLYNDFSENATKMVKNGMSVEAAKTRLLNEVRDNFQSFLKARPKGQPFCFWFGPTLVHRKWEKGSGKALWNINADDLKGKLPKFLPDVPEVREDFADYLGEIQAWDAGVGVILQLLAAAGELENTIIIISGDHGAPGFPG